MSPCERRNKPVPFQRQRPHCHVYPQRIAELYLISCAKAAGRQQQEGRGQGSPWESPSPTKAQSELQHSVTNIQGFLQYRDSKYRDCI
eukprot:1137379-Pelagomonas_calceolata.AAC.9